MPDGGDNTGVDTPEESPSPARALPVIGVVLLLSVLDRWAGGVIVADWRWAAGVTVCVAALMGVPCALWLIERRRREPALFIGLGAVAGALPLLAALASGMIGRFARGGTAWLAEYLGQRAPLPLIGATPCRRSCNGNSATS